MAALYYIRHSSGLFVGPEHGRAQKDTPLVFVHGPPQPVMAFKFENNVLVHNDSGLLVHPLGGQANDNTVLILHPGKRICLVLCLRCKI